MGYKNADGFLHIYLKVSTTYWNQIRKNQQQIQIVVQGVGFFLETHAPTDDREGENLQTHFSTSLTKDVKMQQVHRKRKKLNGDACLLFQLCANWQNMVGWL